MQLKSKKQSKPYPNIKVLKSSVFASLVLITPFPGHAWPRCSPELDRDFETNISFRKTFPNTCTHRDDTNA